jgi:hypothetical protein
MKQTSDQFRQRMRQDKDFRRRILQARRAGTLSECLLEEGYTFDLNELKAHLPQVDTGIIAGRQISCHS